VEAAVEAAAGRAARARDSAERACLKLELQSAEQAWERSGAAAHAAAAAAAAAGEEARAAAVAAARRHEAVAGSARQQAGGGVAIRSRAGCNRV
jgi:hypothetical protein